jgi:hypothetical protein
MKPQPLNKSPYEGLSDEERRRVWEENKRELREWMTREKRPRSSIEIEVDQIEEELHEHFQRQEEEIYFKEDIYAPGYTDYSETALQAREAANEARDEIRNRRFRVDLIRWREVFLARAAAKGQRTKQTWDQTYAAAAEAYAFGGSAISPRTMKRSYIAIQRLRREAAKSGPFTPT